MDEDRLTEMWGQAVDTGVKNLEVLRLAKAWCQHARLDRQLLGTGLVEIQTGLPVGGGRVTCDYARNPVNAESMSLEHLAFEFYEANCIGCLQRLPGGEEPNLGTIAEAAIAERETDAKSAAERRRLVEEARSQRAVDRRLRLRDASERSRHVLDLVERVDGEDSAEAAADLADLAKLEPEAFTVPVLNDLISTALGNRNDALMQAAFELHAARGTPEADLLPLAWDSVAVGIAISPAAAVIARAATSIDQRPQILRRLIELAAGNPHGPWGEREPEPEALNRLFDMEAERVIKALCDLARDEDRWSRSSGARAARRLFLARPTAIEPILPAVLEGLMLPDSSQYYGDPHATSEAAYAVAAALHSSLELAERQLERVWDGADDKRRRRLLRCYRNCIGRFSDRPGSPDLLAQIAARGMSVASASDAELAREGLEIVAQVAKDNDALELELAPVLEALSAIESENERLMAQPVAADLLANLDMQNLCLRRQHLLSKAADAAGCIGAHQPEEFARSLEELWTSSTGREGFRVALLGAVGRASRERASVAFAVPLLSRVLASGTRLERRAALRALEEGSRYGRSRLPPDVAAQVIDSLRQPETATAAVRLLGDLDVPENRLEEVLKALLSIGLSLAPHREDVAREALWAALRLANGTPFVSRVTDIAFDAVEKMPSTDAAEALEAFPQTHPRWIPLAVKSLHADEDPQYQSLGDDDRERLLDQLVAAEPASIAPHLDELVQVATERLPGDPHWAWRIADALASLGEHERAANVCDGVVAIIPSTIEQRRPRAHAERIAIGHRLNAAITERDHDLIEALRDRLKSLPEVDTDAGL